MLTYFQYDFRDDKLAMKVNINSDRDKNGEFISKITAIKNF